MRVRVWSAVFVGLMLSAGTGLADETPRFLITINGMTLLSDSDIVYYNWPKHSISITSEAEARIDSCWPKYLADEWPRDDMNRLLEPITFAVIADGEVVYSGPVHHWPTSCIIEGPWIYWPFLRVRNHGIAIEYRYGFDPRSDVKVQGVLADLGLLLR